MKDLDAKTGGERLFREFLIKKNIPYDYELLDLNKRKRPDFTINLGGQKIICDIKDFDLNDTDELLLESLSTSKMIEFSMKGEDPYKRIRRAVEEKADQLKEYTEYPTSIILYKNPSSIRTDLSFENLLDCLFGNRVLQLKISGDGSIESTTHLQNRAAVLRECKNVHVSSVVIMERQSLTAIHNPFTIRTISQEHYHLIFDENLVYNREKGSFLRV